MPLPLLPKACSKIQSLNPKLKKTGVNSLHKGGLHHGFSSSPILPSQGQRRAYVKTRSERTYLGIYGTPDSREQYQNLVEKLERMYDSTGQYQTTVKRLYVEFLLFAQVHYRDPDGKQTPEVSNYRAPIKYPTINNTDNDREIITDEDETSEGDTKTGAVMFQAFTGSTKALVISQAMIDDGAFDTSICRRWSEDCSENDWDA